MKIYKRWLVSIPLALLAILGGLTGCGSKPIHHHVKLAPQTYQNIKGGGSHGYFSNVKSATELQSKLNTHKNRPKEFLITTNFNGKTNGILQQHNQDEHTDLENKLSSAKQKPKLRVNNNVNESRAKKLHQAHQQQQKQWNNQKKTQNQLQKQIKQQQKNGQKQIQQQTQATVINVPSNTTIVANPNVKLQNVIFQTHGKNIIFKNINLETPTNIPKNHQGKNQQLYKTGFNLQNSNGIKLEHDTMVGTNQKQNKINKNKKSTQSLNVNGIGMNLTNARHVLATKNQFSSLNQGVVEQRGQEANGLHFNQSELQAVQDPFTLNNSYNRIKHVNVQYNRGLSLLYLINPVGLNMNNITIQVHGESPDNVAKQMLKSAKNTTPTAFINHKIEINNKGYEFLNQHGKLVIKAVPSPNNSVLANNVGATLSSKDAREN